MQKRQMDRAQLSASDARQICDRIRPWRHVIGYYIWDEPYGEGELERARRETDLFQFADPARVPFNVAIPSYNDKFTWQNGEFADYLDRYCRIIDPAQAKETASILIDYVNRLRSCGAWPDSFDSIPPIKGDH